MSTEPDFERPRSRPPTADDASSDGAAHVMRVTCRAGLLISGIVSFFNALGSPSGALYMLSAVLAFGWGAHLMKPEK